VSLHLHNTTPLTVIFIKADGTERRMTCTTNHLLIPADKLPNPQPYKEYVADDVIRAFDLEKNAWRSFRKDSIIGVETIDPWKWATDAEIETKSVVEPTIEPKIVGIDDL
jgi:hypothetical protein